MSSVDCREPKGDAADSGKGSRSNGGGTDKGSDVSESFWLVQVFLWRFAKVFRLCVPNSCINVEFALFSSPTRWVLSRVGKR